MSYVYVRAAISSPSPVRLQIELLEEMAGRDTFSLDEVMNELDGMEDDSEDDFDRYFDLDTDERERR